MAHMHAAPPMTGFFNVRQDPGAGAGQFGIYSNPSSVWPDFLVGQANAPVRVLLVDDDPHIRQVIAQELMVDARTMLVGQATSVRGGRRAIKQYEFDVMLVDLHLDDGDGFDLLDYMKAVRPVAQAVMVSSTEIDEQVLRVFERGASGYMVKNAWFGTYVQTVLQVANGGVSITPQFARRMLQRFVPAQAEVDAPAQLVPCCPERKESEKLSARETEVLSMVASGLSNIEIGQNLLINATTVNTHLRNIYRKLQVRTRTQAVRLASLRGLF